MAYVDNKGIVNPGTGNNPLALTERAREAERTMERKYLGGLFVLTDRAARDPVKRGNLIEALDYVGPDDIYAPDYRIIYKTMHNLVDSGEMPDITTVIETLRREGALDKVGGVSAITDLHESEVTAAYLKSRARNIREYARARRSLDAIAVSLPWLRELNDKNEETGKPAVEELQEALASIDVPITDVDVEASADKIFDITEGYLDAVKNGRNSPSSGILMTPWNNLNAITLGFHKKNLWIVAADSGVGKSIFASDIARGCIRHNRRVCYASVEMPQEEVVNRMISPMSSIPYAQIYNKTLTEEDIEKYQTAASELGGNGCLDVIYDTDIRHIGAYARSMASAVGGLDLLIVDHIQELEPWDDKMTTAESLDRITWYLKMLSQTLNIAVIAVSQLNRSGSDTDRRPTLHSLLGSGAIGHNADLVLGLYRERDLNALGEECRNLKPETEVIILKSRNGKRGTVNLIADGPYYTFREPAYAMVSPQKTASESVQPEKKRRGRPHRKTPAEEVEEMLSVPSRIEVERDTKSSEN